LGITLPTAIISQLAGWHSWYPVAKFHFTAASHVFTGFCRNKHNLPASLWGSVLQTISHVMQETSVVSIMGIARNSLGQAK